MVLGRGRLGCVPPADDFDDDEQAASTSAAATSVVKIRGARIRALYAMLPSEERHPRTVPRRLTGRGDGPSCRSHRRPAVPIPGTRDRSPRHRGRPLHDPVGERAAREPRPAPGRGRVPDPVQLPSRPRVGRAPGQGLRDRRARPAQGRRRPRDQAAVPDPVEGAAVAAADRAGQGEPEELHRAHRRVHPRHHRRELPLRRDRERIRRSPLPRGRAALVPGPRARRPLAEPAAAVGRLGRPLRRRGAGVPPRAAPALQREHAVRYRHPGRRRQARVRRRTLPRARSARRRRRFRRPSRARQRAAARRRQECRRARRSAKRSGSG